MTRRILKYTVPVDDQPHTFELTGEPLAVESKYPGSTVDFWVENDDEALDFTRTFQVIGTGHEMPKCSRYVGTAQVWRVGLVWHLIELVKPCQK